MTKDEEAFRLAIEASPNDEAIRKIFADWLDEHDLPEEATYHRRWTVEVRDAENWLKDFAKRCGEHCTNYPDEDEGSWVPITYEMVIASAREWLATADQKYGPEYFTQMGSDQARDLMYDDETRKKFWQCFELATGDKVPDGTAEDGYIFSCSC